MPSTAPAVGIARPGPPFIALDDVSLSYGGNGGTLAVDGVTLRIGQGEFVAVVGPSGCGKSSLLRIVSGLHPPDRGTAIVAGREVTGPLGIVGMAFQNATLLPWRTTLENLLLPLEVSEAYRRTFRRDRAAHVERARALLHAVGLEGFENHAPHQLSGGMQQRASLCRALVHRPQLLLLDEPFAALDAFTREELWDVLQNLWLTERFTVVLVTHDLREAAYLADTIYVVSKRPARIVERRPVPLPRPRRLATTFEPAFVDIVHALRDRIGQVRAG